MKYEWTDAEKHTIRFTASDDKEYFFSPDPDNVDYQAYLEWEAIDGNDITIMSEAY